MARSNGPSYAVEFPLQATPEQVNQVELRLSFLRKLYNVALAELFKRQNKNEQNPEYYTLLSNIRQCRKTKDNKALKQAYDALNQLNSDYGIQSFGTHNKNACCF